MLSSSFYSGMGGLLKKRSPARRRASTGDITSILPPAGLMRKKEGFPGQREPGNSRCTMVGKPERNYGDNVFLSQEFGFFPRSGVPIPLKK
jgi:hypothetical protein